jgi:hypothetical protein
MNVKLLFAVVAIFYMQNVYGQDSLGMPTVNINADYANRPIHWQDVSKVTNKLVLYEDSLAYYIDSVYFTKDFDKRQGGNYELIRLMKGMLKQPNSYAYAFDTLSTKMNILQPSSKAFKIYQWDMLDASGFPRYFGVIQLASGKLYPLVDISAQIAKQAEDSILTNTRWFGASYYNIIEKSTTSGPAYFLLGLNSNNDKSERKVLDVLQFTNKGEAVFGAPMFQTMTSKTPKMCNRFIAEYQKDSHISMNWSNEENMIIYDHLESTIGDNAKRYSFVSDGTYDGLRWTGKMWQIVPNAIQITATPEGAAPVLQQVQKKQLNNFEDAVEPTATKKKK